MSILDRILHKEPEFKDPIDTPIEHASTALLVGRALTGQPARDYRDIFRDPSPYTPRATLLHKHHDGFGAPLHTWHEKRVQAIEATCTECDKVELHSDHAGALKGSKRAVGHTGTKPLLSGAAERAKRNEEWRRYYEAGQSSTAIAATYGVTPRIVTVTLNKIGVQMRPKGPVPKKMLGDGPNPRLTKLVVTPKGARRGSRPEVTARNAEWQRLYESGQTVAFIAETYDIPKSSIYDALRRAGVKMDGRAHPQRSGPEDAERAAEIIRLRTEEYLTYDAIGAKFHITRERVRQILKKSGADTHALMEARLDVMAKKRQPKPPSICRFCGMDFTGTPYWQHSKENRLVANHNPHPRAAEFRERDKLIAADYAAGMKVNDIKAKYHIEPSTISRAISDMGVSKRRPNANFLKTKAEIDARKAAILEDLKAGMRRHDIAAKYAISEGWVSLVGKGASVRTAKFSMPNDEEKARWVSRYQAGLSANAVAREFGRAQTTIANHLHRAGVIR